jgi:hypothetical protein
MNTLSKRITKVLPEFEERVQVLEQSYSSYVSFAKPESDRDVEQISSLRTALRNLLEKIDPAKKGVMTFRDSALSLKEQNISEHLSKAAVSQAHSLHLLVANMEDIESFALRINFQIDEKFKGRDERS